MFLRDAQVAYYIHRTTEGLVLLLVALSPWAFGSIHPLFRYFLTVGISAVMFLWAIELAVLPRQSARNTSVTRYQLLLAILIAIGFMQVIPLGELQSVVTPGTSELKSKLFPATREVLADGTISTPPDLSADRRVSFYPAATFSKCLWFIQLGLLFTRIQNLASPNTLRRLCLVCLVNGSLLGYFSLVQFFSAEQGTLYWTFQSQGSAFGPFVNRNHFAFYMNICLGLAIGLIGSRLYARHPSSPLELLRIHLKDSVSVAIGVSLIFMSVAIVLSSSRGGLISLLVAIASVITIGVLRKKGLGSVALITIGVSATLLLLTWLGFSLFESRYASIWEFDTTQDERWATWQQLLPLVWEFPQLGTGLGTLGYVEPMMRTSGDTVHEIVDHAHNEYLHIAIEAGLVAFCSVVVFVAILVCASWQLARTSSGRQAALYVGLLFALVAVSVHSLFEFGLQMPAIAVLATAVFGQITGAHQALRSHLSAVPDLAPHHDILPSLIQRSARFAVALLLIAIAVISCRDARSADLADRSRLAALRARADGNAAAELSHFETASRIRPQDAQLAFEVARLHLAAASRNDRHALTTAQRELVAARDLCPLLAEAHVLMGKQTTTFPHSDTTEQYIERARVIRPADATLAYIAGTERLAARDPQTAIVHLRQSLSLSRRHLYEILQLALLDFAPDELVFELIPQDNAVIMAAAADWLEKQDTNLALFGQQLRERAILLPEIASADTAEEHYLRAGLLAKLDEIDESRSAYLSALRLAPEKNDWRMELARMLNETNQLDAAKEQLKKLLRQRPNDLAARRLAKEIALKDVLQ